MSLFSSFWMAGYECSDQLNCFGDRVDLLRATQHLHFLEHDYDLLRRFSISTVREGVQWSITEYAPYHYDWSAMERTLLVARQKGVQVLWDLCHFGYPDDLSPLHPHFSKRFTAYATAFVHQYRSIEPDGLLVVTPINEVSFMAWLGGDAAATSPFTRHYGWEVKYALMGAYIAAIRAMKSLDSGVRVLTTEPLINILPECPEVEVQAKQKNEAQHQVLDILTGKLCPELGGHPTLVDVVGCNYYRHNQWRFPSEEPVDWQKGREVASYQPLSSLCQQMVERYNIPFVITETSNEGDQRGPWIAHVTEECQHMLTLGLPLWGVCLYPVLNRPDWDFPHQWHDSGIWSVDLNTFERSISEPYADTLNQCMAKIPMGSAKAAVRQATPTTKQLQT